MFKKILVVVLILAIVAVVVVQIQPNQFRIERSTTIRASAADVFAQVNDLHKWEAWSPWAKRDPAMKQTYEGPESGVGAISSWSGNKEVGEGRMTITQSQPSELVRIKLEFLKPYKATNVSEFKIQPQGDQSMVTWSMSGENDFMMKAVHLVMNMDKMVGADFEKGLANLKSLAEGPARK
jgi:Polyketide cyclase / dehydrase and lipid transport